MGRSLDWPRAGNRARWHGAHAELSWLMDRHARPVFQRVCAADADASAGPVQRGTCGFCRSLGRRSLEGPPASQIVKLSPAHPAQNREKFPSAEEIAITAAPVAFAAWLSTSSSAVSAPGEAFHRCRESLQGACLRPDRKGLY